MGADGATIAVTSAIIVSLTAVVACTVASWWIIDDVRDFYENTMKEMGEFQRLTEDAWTEVLPMTVGASETSRVRVPRPSLSSIFRSKRQMELPSQCNCNIHQNSCPPGPPGENGRDGAPGVRGEPGHSGPNGMDGHKMFAHEQTYNKACVVCPAGPPGPKGNPGTPGAAGLPGMPGARAQNNGGAGQAGPPGPPGDAGPIGTPGQPGRMGEPGRNGIRYLPGPPGRPGMPGRRGPTGPSGPAGVAEEGPDGLPGSIGIAGMAGTPGSDGEPGIPGLAGLPGSDASYCPCPKRSASVELGPPAYKPQIHAAVIHEEEQEEQTYSRII